MKGRHMTRSAVMLILLRDCEHGRQVLLQRRQNTGYADGMWDFAATGHVDAGESMTMAVRREAMEELGIDIPPGSLEFATITHRNVGDAYYNGFFTATGYIGRPRIMEPHKCSGLEWFCLDALPDNFIEDRRRALMNYLAGISYSEEGWAY